MIVPDTDELAVEMKVSGNDMPLIHEGDRVRLQFEGWPAVQFVGWPSVAVGTFGGKVNRVFPTDDGMGNFRVVVTPDNHFAREDGWPDDRYLRQGVRANGWVLLKQVPLGYEIWRQLNGFPTNRRRRGTVKSDDKGSKVKLPKPRSSTCDEFQQIADVAVCFERMSQRFFDEHLIPILTPDFFAANESFFFQLLDNSLHRSFGDANLCGNLT